MMTAGKDYGVKVLVAFGFNSVGQVIYPTGVVRQHLVEAGFCEPVAPPPGPIARAVDAARTRIKGK
jgi:hypothetical protein